MKKIFLSPFIIILVTGVSFISQAASKPKNDVIKDLREDSLKNGEDQKSLIASEVLISRSEEKALSHLKVLIKKYVGTSMEPELKFRLAELYMNRAKSARFIEQMVSDDDGVASFLPSKIKSLKERKMVESAIYEYSDIEKKYPKYKSADEVLFNKAFAQLQIDREKQAEQTFIKLLRTQRRSKLRPDAFLAVGEINFKRRDFRKALAYFNRVKKYKDARVYPYGLYKGSWCYYNLDGYEQAMSELEKVIYFGAKIEKEGKDQRLDLRVEALTDMSLFYSSIRPAKNAVDYFQKLSGTKNPLPALRKLARIYEKHGKDIKQEIVLSDLVEAFPKSEKRPFFHRDLARNLNRQAKYQKSVAQLWSFYSTCKSTSGENSEEPCQDDVDSLSKRLAVKWLKIYKENKDRTIMSAAAENAFRVHLADKKAEDENSKMRFLFAEHLFELKKYEESSQEYTKVGDSSKDKERHHKARYAAIVSYDLSHGSDLKGKAIPRFRYLSEAYMKEFPAGEKYLDVGFKLGLLDYSNKEYDLAGPLLVQLGDKFSQLEKGKKSQDLYLDILNSKKEYIDIQAFAKKWKSTEKDLVRVTALQNIYEQAFFSEVALLEERKEYEKSIARYISFIEENPESKLVDEARWNKIDLHFKLKEYDKTAKGYIAFHQLHPKHKNAIPGLVKAVEIYEMMAEPEFAYTVAETLIIIDRKNTERWSFLSATYLKASGQYEPAAKKFLNIYYTPSKNKEIRAAAKEEFFNLKRELLGVSPWYKARIKGLMQSGSREVASIAVRSYAEYLKSSNDNIKEFNMFVANNKWNKKLLSEKKAILHMYDGQRKEGWFINEKLENTSMDAIVRTIQAKTKRMDAAQRAYQRSLEDEDAKVSIQALLGLSRVYQQYVDDLKQLTPPSTFSEEETEALKGELSNIIMPFEEKAAEAIDQALKVAQEAKIKDGSLKEIKILFDKVNLDEKVVYPIVLKTPEPIGPRGY